MTNTILSKRYLNNEKTLIELVVDQPLIAQHAKGGNFVILRLDERGERFPLTIADYNRKAGTITMVVMRVGKSTNQLATLDVGDQIKDIVGPLGNSVPAVKYAFPIVFIGGGVGIAPIHPQIKEFKAAGNFIISILGVRTKSLLFWEDRIAKFSDELIITTDDGSYGKKGLVTDRLEEIIEHREIAHVTAIGPMVMMKYVALATKKVNIPTTVSLNTMMVDGTGMCGGCRFRTLSGEIKFACVDGPDVDGHDVDFDNLLKRNRRFIEEERKRLEAYEQQCRALNQLQRT